MGKDLFMAIRERCPLCCRCRWPGVAGGGGGGGGGGGTASSRPLSATSKSSAAIIKVQTEDHESQGHHPAIPMAICEKFNSPLSSIETFPPTSTSWRPTHPSVKQAHRTEDVPVESLNYLKRGIGDISGNLGLRFLKPCEAVDPHFPGFGLIFLLISDIKALKYNCLSRLSPQNISNPPLYQP